MSHFIGKTISLISNKGLRYVGLLDNINAEDATVALKSVRSFGTEGRMSAGGTQGMEVPPGKDIYDYVVFRGSDVKDLTVLDTPIEQIQPVPYSGAPAAPAAPGPGPAPAPTAHYSAFQQQAPVAPQHYVQPGGPHVMAPMDANGVSATPSQAVPPTQTSAQAQLQPDFAPVLPSYDESTKEKLAGNTEGGDYDFQAANAAFSKEYEVEKRLEQPQYNKSSSFFDNISTSTNENNTMTWSEEKDLNIDTFGAVNLGRRGGGRGRGYGRGRDRGRGRGRGRGGSRGGRGNYRGRD